ncbi:ABC transporter substrate-binding protein [Actinoplanes sp. N902-109]|uniref:ABC transporter substrate-binding protein n=1 Tax=Actinoplanes sp. (strain N902-109) TaxID=649831 RepID=UPI0003294DA7|nr:ABC transporter substrate-binding protein [Actinoplanes sp. N902-109]AGL17598.1 proline/glycine betaine ABC transporter periplasmic component-like protein [Actinoplanes sp. N902-109]
MKRLLVLVLVLTVGGCGGASSTAGGSGEKTVKLAVNPWVGYEANAAVLAYLLEHELGYTVDRKNLKEEIAWQGFETGEVDAIVENWGHDDLKKTYIQDKKVAVDAGPTGNKGVIGWYVPQWMAEQYPDITDWKNLNKYASLFRTSESGGKGQMLDGDPSFVTNDVALVANLKLDYKVVFSGSEAAIIKAAQQATAQKKPLLFYFYEPQWLFAKEKYARVKLPAYTAGCDADPKKVACDYPDYTLDKIVSKRFADTGGSAYQLIQRFRWTNEDQNLVADAITNQGLSADDAARKWVGEHEATWKAWL